jgi:hypothetical protein
MDGESPDSPPPQAFFPGCEYSKSFFPIRRGYRQKEFCDSVLLNTTPRSEFIEERQAMRDIVAVIRSPETKLGY